MASFGVVLSEGLLHSFRVTAKIPRRRSVTSSSSPVAPLLSSKPVHVSTNLSVRNVNMKKKKNAITRFASHFVT